MGKRFGIVETVIISLVTFLGMGIYNMYKVHKEVNYYKEQDKQVQELQDKYCNIQDPTPEQQKICIDVLKAQINKGRKK